jgi:hypothetical protein
MAEPVEDKGFLGEKLEEDRQKMAVQVDELNMTTMLSAGLGRRFRKTLGPGLSPHCWLVFYCRACPHAVKKFSCGLNRFSGGRLERSPYRRLRQEMMSFLKRRPSYP